MGITEKSNPRLGTRDPLVEPGIWNPLNGTRDPGPQCDQVYPKTRDPSGETLDLELQNF